MLKKKKIKLGVDLGRVNRKEDQIEFWDKKTFL